MDLYKLTDKEAIGVVVDSVAEDLGISKKEARILVKNALIYNCVIDEITGQCRFLSGRE